MGSKITRPNIDFPIFGSDAQADELTIFGTDTESTDITALLTNTNSVEGWASGVDSNGFPALSWFNAVGHTLSYITAYYLQNGIPEWVALQEYFIGSKAVASDGFTYVSKTDNNIGNTPVGDSTNWRLAFLDSANTVVYVPTTNYNPATKKYVDDLISAIDLSNFVDKTTNQTIWGIKTFSVFPITPSSNPTTNYQVVNKKYVDDAVAAIPSGGKVLQVVSATKTDTFSSSSSSFIDITGLSINITPSSTSSKIMILSHFTGDSNNGARCGMRVLRDSTPVGVGGTAGSRKSATSGGTIGGGDNTTRFDFSGTHLDSPSTTSPITYKIQGVAEGAGTIYVNRSASDVDDAAVYRTASSITVMEIGV